MMHLHLTLLLPLFASAIPLPARPNNTLSNGINANLDAGNSEITTVQTAQSLVSNKTPAAQVSAAIGQIQGALTEAVGDRKANQAIAAKAGKREFILGEATRGGLLPGSMPYNGLKQREAATPVQEGLAKVEAVQGKAQAAVSSLTEGAGDANTLAGLKTTFENGFKTNVGNLALAQAGKV